MAAGDIILTSSGARALLPDGSLLLDDGDCTPCPECGVSICSDHANCRTYCDSEKGGVERSEACDCPCDGGKDYPTSYLRSLGALSIKTGVKIQMTDGRWARVTETTPASTTWEDCEEGDEGQFTIELFDTDGETLLDTDTGARIRYTPPEFAPGAACGWPGCDPSKLYYANNLSFSMDFASFANTTIIGDSVGNTDFTMSRCDGGEVEISSPFLNSPVTLTITPTCVDCENDPIVESDDPHTRCADEITVDVNLWEGELDEFDNKILVNHLYTLIGGDGRHYNGNDLDGNTANIEVEDARLLMKRRERQRIRLAGQVNEEGCADGSPSGGTFTLTYGPSTTSTLAHNASDGDIETAMNAVLIAPITCTVADSGIVTFDGLDYGETYELLEGDGASLTSTLGTPEVLIDNLGEKGCGNIGDSELGETNPEDCDCNENDELASTSGHGGKSFKGCMTKWIMRLEIPDGTTYEFLGVGSCPGSTWDLRRVSNPGDPDNPMLGSPPESRESYYSSLSVGLVCPE